MENNIHYMNGSVANEGRWALTLILESFKMETVLNESWELEKVLSIGDYNSKRSS